MPSLSSILLSLAILISAGALINSFFGRSKLMERIDEIEQERSEILSRVDSTMEVYREKNQALEKLVSNQQQKIAVLNQGVTEARILSQAARDSLEGLDQEAEDLWESIGGAEDLNSSNQ